jgi:magnesium transporter
VNKRHKPLKSLRSGRRRLSHLKDKDVTQINLFHYDETDFHSQFITNAEEFFAFKEQDRTTWIDIQGISDIALIEKICTHYGLHTLMIEDILNVEQHSKLDVFDHYIFFTMKSYEYLDQSQTFQTKRISVILGKNFVITVHEHPSNIFKAIQDRLYNTNTMVRKGKADYLVYELLDILVDNYYKVLEVLGDSIEDIEDELVNQKYSPKTTIQSIHSLKKELLFIKKAVWPLREIVNALQHKIHDLIQDSTTLYMKDVYDHIIQIVDTVETYRDILSGLLEIHMLMTSNHTNEIMKVLTIFTSIFIPLTFITGIYGMNFNTQKSFFNMPELNWPFGYFFSLGIMLVIVVVMLLFFKKRKWF